MYSTFLEELQVSTFIVPLPHSDAFQQSLSCRPKFLCVQQPIIVTFIPTGPSLILGAGFSWGRKRSGLSIQEKGNWDETSNLSQGCLVFCLPCSHPRSSGFSVLAPVVPARGVLPGTPRSLVTFISARRFLKSGITGSKNMYIDVLKHNNKIKIHMPMTSHRMKTFLILWKPLEVLL